MPWEVHVAAVCASPFVWFCACGCVVGVGRVLNAVLKCWCVGLCDGTTPCVLSVGSGELVFWPKHFEVLMLGRA